MHDRSMFTVSVSFSINEPGFLTAQARRIVESEVRGSSYSNYRIIEAVVNDAVYGLDAEYPGRGAVLVRLVEHRNGIEFRNVSAQHRRGTVRDLFSLLTETDVGTVEDFI